MFVAKTVLRKTTPYFPFHHFTPESDYCTYIVVCGCGYGWFGWVWVGLGGLWGCRCVGVWMCGGTGGCPTVVVANPVSCLTSAPFVWFLICLVSLGKVLCHLIYAVFEVHL